MAKRARKKPARRIANRRDYEGASAAVKHLSSQTDRDSAAELRLQSLLRELDRFDDADGGEMADDPDDDFNAPGPRRRWSDDQSGDD